MPENWKTYNLGDVANIVTGKLNSNKAIPDGKYPFFTCSPETLKINDYSFDQEAILLAGNNANAIYSIKHYKGKFNAYQRTYVIDANKETVHLKYLFYLLGLRVNYLKDVSQGTATKFLTMGLLHNIVIELPEIEEQKSIASILSALDDKIELNLQMNKTLEEMAMALYKHWFVDFGPFQDEYFVDSELGEIPKGWKNAILGDLINLNPRLSLAKGSQASFVEMKVLPIDVMSVSDVAQKEFKGGAKFQNGDTLFARITPCLENGKTAFVDFLESGEIAFGSTEFLVMRAKEGVSKYWTYCLARDTNFRNFAISTMVGTSGRQRVQNDPFLSYEIPQPPKEIFDSFSEIAEPWFKQIRINTIENQMLTQLRDTLLPKLISGEVRVKDAEKTLSEVL